MVIVLIHWKIHLGAEQRRLFLRHWKETLTIEERSHLIGEYLSEPMPESKTGFPCTTFNVPTSSKYQSFFNVGVWDSVEAFKKLVVDPYVGTMFRTQPFEYEFRERMILTPLSWRAGNGKLLPENDHFSE